MNCQNLEHVINALAREQMIDASVRARALNHIETCPRCETRLAEERKLTDVLRRFSNDRIDYSAAASLEGKLREEFRNHHRGSSVEKTPGRKRHGYFYAAAAAAAVLLVIGAGIVFRSRENNSIVGIQKFESPLLPVVSPSGSSFSPDARVVSTALPRRRQAKPRPTHLTRFAHKSTVNVDLEASNLEVEVASAFMPIGSSIGTIQEGGQVVRVEFPRLAMARFGLPVNMDRYDERVKADVWLGADGVAHAIRFVQ